MAQKNFKQRIKTRWYILFVIVSVLWLTYVSDPGSQVLGCFDGCSAGPAEPDGVFRVVSFNILHDFPRFRNLTERIELISSEILEKEADIVFLQEVPWTLGTGYAAEKIARQTGMNYAYLRANGNRNMILFEEGLVILSRYPLVEVAFTELKPQAVLFEHRVALYAVARTEAGEIGLFNTHLTHRSVDTNRKQFAELVRFIERYLQGKAIIAGDFNASEDSVQMLDRPAGWIDGYRVANEDEKGYTCCLDDLTDLGTRGLSDRLDYIFLASYSEKEFKVIGASLINLVPYRLDGEWFRISDHIGIFLEFEIP